jgi:hypothetical protein
VFNKNGIARAETKSNSAMLIGWSSTGRLMHVRIAWTCESGRQERWCREVDELSHRIGKLSRGKITAEKVQEKQMHRNVSASQPDQSRQTQFDDTVFHEYQRPDDKIVSFAA